MTKASRRKARRIRAAKVAIAELRVAQRRAARAAGTQASPKLYTRKDRELLVPMHGSTKQKYKHANKKYARARASRAAELAATADQVRNATANHPIQVLDLTFFGSTVPFLIHGTCVIDPATAADLADGVATRMRHAIEVTSADGYERVGYSNADEDYTDLAAHLEAIYPDLDLTASIVACAVEGLEFRLRFRYDRAFLEIGWAVEGDSDLIAVCALAASRDDVTGEPYAGDLDTNEGIALLVELLDEAATPARGELFAERFNNTLDIVLGRGGDPALPTLIR